MKYCKYCGSQIDDHTPVCPHCNRTLNTIAKTSSAGSPAVSAKTAVMDKTGFLGKGRYTPMLIIISLVLIAGILIMLLANANCDYSGCGNKPVSGYGYCYSHKCAISDCGSSCYLYSNYCYTHYLLYDDDASSDSNYVASYELKISGVNVYSSSNYTYAEGTITNNSDSTVSFVEIKGAFKTSAGKVVDTDWTYAVGSEGLAPGESCKWKLSVSKDSSIKDCDISILDYNY